VTDDKAILDLLGPLMRALEMLAFVARHVHPPDFDRLMESVGGPDEELREARARQGEWPRHLSGVRAALDASSDAVLEAFSGLREVSREGGEIRSVYRALRLLPRALESLYPLAGVLPPVNRFFLDPTLRADEGLQRALLDAPAQDGTGVMHCQPARNFDPGSACNLDPFYR
jgi:phospholipase/carboxylesterase